MAKVRALARAHGVDALIVLAALEGAIEVAFREDAERQPLSSHWFAVPAIVIVVLPLLARKRHPFAAPASVWALAAAISFVDGRLIPYAVSAVIAGFASAFMLGNLRDLGQARLGLAIVLAGALIVAVNDPNHAGGDLASLPLLFAIGWTAGFAMRGRSEQAERAEARAAQAEREREAVARVAVAEERARIARELHDIVAHAVSVMVLQAGAVRHKLPDSLPGERNALEVVERTGRTALAEMRSMLEAMRRDGEDVALEPQPGLSRIGALAEQIGQAGLPVHVSTEGEPYPLPGALDLSAFRIIQEGVTNALKHSGADRVDVTVRYDAGELGIEVLDDGVGAADSDGRGHGLIGIEERVKVFGGELTAGPRDGSGFALRARLPVRIEAP